MLRNYNEIINKKVVIAPYNDVARGLKSYFDQSIDFQCFADNKKKGSNIVSFNVIPADIDCLIIVSPNYWKELVESYKGTADIYIYNPSKHTLIRYSQFLLYAYPIVEIFASFSNSFTKCKIKVKSFIRLVYLQNHYTKKRAFLIGNGPSLKIDDLNRLQNEITFGCNKIYLAFQSTKWRPTFYVVEDRLDMSEYGHLIDELVPSVKFVPDKFLYSHPLVTSAVYYPYRYGGDDRIFSTSIFKGFYSGYTVLYTMLELAAFMGIKEIYLLGVDFNYIAPTGTKAGEIIKDEGARNHFHPNYRQTGDEWFEPNLDNQKKSYLVAKAYADNHGIKIYNVSNGSKLNVFKKDSFERILSCD